MTCLLSEILLKVADNPKGGNKFVQEKEKNKLLSERIGKRVTKAIKRKKVKGKFRICLKISPKVYSWLSIRIS